MSLKPKNFSLKIAFLSFVFAMILVPFQTTFAQSGAEGIPLEKDVFLQWPISSAEEMPNEVTFFLYDSENALTPIASQSFPRGAYTADFDISKSDGVASGSIARFRVNFTNNLNMGNDSDNPIQVREIWAEVQVDGMVVGDRTKVQDETLVKLLLASDASLKTYLTFAYEGDDNPITTIYRDLPLSSSSGKSVNEYFTSMFKYYSSIDPYAPQLATAITGDTVNGNLTVTGRFYAGGTTALGAAPMVLGQILGNRGIVITDKAATNKKNIYFGWNVGASFDYAELFALQEGIAFKNLVLNPLGGNVGVRTTSPLYTLAVNGTIGCKELTVTSTGWADFVFEDGYKLPSLKEVEAFIGQNKHLPGIPTETEVKEKGVSIGDMSAKLLQKVEELTLYVIDLKKENDLLKNQLDTVQQQIQVQKN